MPNLLYDLGIIASSFRPQLGKGIANTPAAPAEVPPFYFLDEFSGTGNLTTHISDTKHAYYRTSATGTDERTLYTLDGAGLILGTGTTTGTSPVITDVISGSTKESIEIKFLTTASNTNRINVKLGTVSATTLEFDFSVNGTLNSLDQWVVRANNLTSTQISWTGLAARSFLNIGSENTLRVDYDGVELAVYFNTKYAGSMKCSLDLTNKQLLLKTLDSTLKVNSIKIFKPVQDYVKVTSVYSSAQATPKGQASLPQLFTSGSNTSFSTAKVPFDFYFFGTNYGSGLNGGINFHPTNLITFGYTTAVTSSYTASNPGRRIDFFSTGASASWYNMSAGIENGAYRVLIYTSYGSTVDSQLYKYELTFFQDQKIQLIAVQLPGYAANTAAGSGIRVSDGSTYTATSTLFTATSYVLQSDANGNNWTITQGSAA